MLIIGLVVVVCCFLLCVCPVYLCCVSVIAVRSLLHGVWFLCCVCVCVMSVSVFPCSSSSVLCVFIFECLIIGVMCVLVCLVALLMRVWLCALVLCYCPLPFCVFIV